jgi:small subunit ribosomal protein S6
MAARKKETVQVEDKQLRDYELAFIVSPEVADESLENAISGISQFIADKGGTISDVEHWGKRKLAYPLRQFLEGNYILARFKINPARCKELEANLKISEDILRHLLIKLGS